MESEGRRIHGLAAQARERGESQEALKLADEALIEYQKEGDLLGLAEIEAEKTLIYRHLYQATDDQNYLILAKYSAKAGVEIAEKSGNKQSLALPYFNLAKAQEELGEYSKAVENYQKSLDNIIQNPPEEHKINQRPAMIADFKVHLFTCKYKAGDKSALEKAEQALKELEEGAEIAKYNKDVWLSGGHMSIAEMLKIDDPEKAKEHLEKAKEIIDANPDLKLRKAQWEKLTQTF